MHAGDQPDRTGWLVVDALNVIGSRPDGWWRDRAAAVERFVARVRAYAEANTRRVTVVVDGRAPAAAHEAEQGMVDVVYAQRSGPGAADDRIVELLAWWRERGADRGAVAVVTADRELRVRVRALGAEIVSPRSFLTTLDSLGE